jgi:type II secretion system protein G
MIKFLKRILKDQKGFTLIELVFAVIILAVLAGVALINLGSTEDDAKNARVEADLRTISTAIKVYKAKEGHYPAKLEDLTSAGTNYQPMLDEIPSDPWGSDYIYEIDEETGKITLKSANGETRTMK